MKKEIVIEFCAALLILLFIYSGFSKIFDFNGFRDSMTRQPLFPWLSAVLIWMLPSIEIITAFLLMLRRTQMIGLYLSLAMMAAFTFYIMGALLKLFSHVPCSCGGVIKKLSWQQHLYFNIFFLVITVMAVILKRKNINYTKTTNQENFNIG